MPQSWLANLAPGESRLINYTFAPQSLGEYRFRVSVRNGGETLASHNTAYVVGDGPAVSVNVNAQSVYSPSLAIDYLVTVANTGNMFTATTLSLVTFQALTPEFTTTIPLTLSAGAVTAFTATVLPADLAQPGLYTTKIYLGDNLYSSHEFAVAAEDTLFADIALEHRLYDLDDTVPLTVSVSNSTFEPTDTSIGVVIQQPDGITATITMTRTMVGEYHGMASVPISGTYIVSVDVSKSKMRGVGTTTVLVAVQESTPIHTLTGEPVLGLTRPITFSLRNEWNIPLAGARITISGTHEYLQRLPIRQVSRRISHPYCNGQLSG